MTGSEQPATAAFTIVVGIGRTGASSAALHWAVAEAQHHHGVVRVVRAWRAPRPPAAVACRPPMMSVDGSGDFEAAEQELAAEITAAVGADSGVVGRVVRGGRRKVLLDAATAADLLVIDAPQRRVRRTSTTLAYRLIHRAGCPVVVVPPVHQG